MRGRGVGGLRDSLLKGSVALCVLMVMGSPLATRSSATPSQAAPRDPCTILTRSQVQHLLLGKRVVKLKRRRSATNQAVECTWLTGYYQTKAFKGLSAPFSLKLSLQPTATATVALEDLRAKAREFENQTTETIHNLGDEAFRNFGDVIVVAGATVFQVGAKNYDTSAKPHPRVDQIARQAAALVLEQLAAQVPNASSSPTT